MTSLFIRLNPRDNVLVARANCPAGAAVEGAVTSRAQVPAGHKVAACDIAAGAPILKFATAIGFAARDIAAGDYVHRHNVAVRDIDSDLAFCADARPSAFVPEAARARFQGIVRPDGRVATRNYIGVMATVNCSTSVCQMIADHFCGAALAEYPNVDGVVALGHGTGCGIDAGEGLSVLRRTLTGYARHPNFAGLLIVGLGCERNQIMGLMDSDGLEASEMLHTMTIQDLGGTRATVARAI